MANFGSINSSTVYTGTGAPVLATSPTLSGANLGSTSIASTQTFGDSSTKLATTAFVQSAITGTTILAAAKVATTANLVGVYVNGASGIGATFTYTATGVDTIDGVALTLGMRILVKNQTSSFQNGIYTVTTAGAIGVAGVLTRSTDYDQSGEIDIGDTLFVISGTTQGATSWVQNGTENPVMGTDPITFVQTAGPGSYTAGNGLTLTGTSFSIDTSITVDKTTAQVLTNKDLTSGTNTFPTFNQNTTGSAAKWTTPRLLAGNSVDGSTNVPFANKFISQGTTDTGLTNAQFLGALASGYVKNTTTTGVLSTVTTIPASDISGGAALTKTDDTNVTLTLGGTPASALLAVTSLTLGWTGTLSGTRGGTGVNNGASTFTIGGNVVFSGAFTFTGTITANTAVTFPTSGTLLTAASAVTSITGTTNQVIASASVGAVTLSLPQDIATTSTPQFARLGLGAAADATKLLFITGNVTGGVATIERTNASTNAVLGTFTIRGTSTGDMVDGFGTAFQFAIQDNAGVENIIANIQAARNGADNTGILNFVTASAGSLGVRMQLAIGTLTPGSNDGLALGTTALNFSDLFLATGAVINYNNGNVVLTHSSGVLTLGTGDLQITTAGTNTASVVTVGGTQTLTAKTLTSPTITGATITTSTVNGVTLTTGGSASTFLNGAGAYTTPTSGALIIGTTAITSGTTGRVLYDNAGVLGEMTNTGTGTVNVLQTSPTLITPVIGVATGTSLALTGVLTAGTNASTTDYPAAQAVISQGNTTDTDTRSIGVAAEAIATSSVPSAAFYGQAKTNGTQDGAGVFAQAQVTASADTGIAYGGNFGALSTHSGGQNIGVFGKGLGSTQNNLGVRGEGSTAGSNAGFGVLGAGLVTASANTGRSHGVWGEAVTTHSGGDNVGLYGAASGSSTNNYGLWVDTGLSRIDEGILLGAGTTAIAPIQYTSGTNLTSAAAGVREYDGVQHYGTIDTTSGRGAIAVEQYFHLTANGSAITTIANFFGTTSNMNIVASAYYIIEIYAWYVTTGSGAVTWTFTNSAAPTSQNIIFEGSPLLGVNATPATGILTAQILNDTTAAKTVATGSLSAATHFNHFKIWLKNGTGTTFKIQATAGGTNLTPQIGSWYTARRVSPNNIGTFAA